MEDELILFDHSYDIFIEHSLCYNFDFPRKKRSHGHMGMDFNIDPTTRYRLCTVSVFWLEVPKKENIRKKASFRLLLSAVFRKKLYQYDEKNIQPLTQKYDSNRI